MRREGFAFQLRMKLHPDKPRVILHLDDLRQFAIRRHAREDQSAFFKLGYVFGIHFIAVAVAFLDLQRAVDAGHGGAGFQDGGVGAKAHGTAFVITGFALHDVVALHPFFQVVNHGREAFCTCLNVEFF